MPIIEFYRNNQANIMTKNVCYIISKCYLVGEKTTFKEIKMHSQKPILLNDSKVSKLINDDTKGCYYFDNNWLKFSKKMSPVSNDEIDNISKDAIVIYTTETVEDIINSYQTYDNINLHELEKQQDKSTKKLIKKIIVIKLEFL